MDEPGTTETSGRRPNKTLIVVATIVGLLALMGAIGGGPGAAFSTLGMAVFVIGLIAVVRGRASWAHIAGRRAATAVVVAGVVAMGFGGAMTPSTGTQNTAAEAAAPSTSATPSSTAPASSAAPKSTAARNSTAAKPLVAAPATITSQAPALPPAPDMALTCPQGGSVANPVFGQQISAAAPYTVTIDYGDGDSYTNDQSHLGAIFSHTYGVSGNFVVNATLTDAVGQTASASCSYQWVKPVPVPATSGSSSDSVSSNPGSSGAGSATGGGSSSDGDTYTNVDGNEVHVPVQAPSAPAGATAQCRDGSWSFSQNHSGTCSHHGGVAQWLG